MEVSLISNYSKEHVKISMAFKKILAKIYLIQISDVANDANDVAKEIRL